MPHREIAGKIEGLRRSLRARAISRERERVAHLEEVEALRRKRFDIRRGGIERRIELERARRQLAEERMRLRRARGGGSSRGAGSVILSRLASNLSAFGAAQLQPPRAPRRSESGLPAYLEAPRQRRRGRGGSGLPVWLGG